MPRALRAGFSTHWTTYGQGARAALMIHCSLASGTSWGGMARHLSGALTMTAFDLPGHGRSAEWGADAWRDVEIQDQVTQIAASFADDISVSPVDVIGHSFGATVALRLAVEYPHLVRSFVLIEPVFFAVAYRDRPDLGAAHDAVVADFMAAQVAGDHAGAAREFTALWGDGTPWAAVPDVRCAKLALQMPLIAAAESALFGDVGGMLVEGVLEAVEQPVLLVEGSRSPAIIRAIHDGLAVRLPDAQCVMVMGAGHMAPITHAQQVSAEVLRFLQAHARVEY